MKMISPQPFRQQVASDGQQSTFDAAAANAPKRKEKTILRGECYEAVRRIADFLEPNERVAFQVISSAQHDIFYPQLEDKISKITLRLLLAVAYGMESADVNVPLKKSDSDELFKHNFYAKDLLEISPEYLLERGDITDWAGRTFKNITAFEYALWAKDFKMIDMMLGCIPRTTLGTQLIKELLRQFEQITRPIIDGGGITYTLGYLRPNLDKFGVPMKMATGNWDCEMVSIERWENHFDLNSLINAYESYLLNFEDLSWHERSACWIKDIGTLQKLLPVHILQRYCDSQVPFYPSPEFDDKFMRSSHIYDNKTNGSMSFYKSSLSSDFALIRGGITENVKLAAPRAVASSWHANVTLKALRKLDKVTTNKMELIAEQLLVSPCCVAARPWF